MADFYLVPRVRFMSSYGIDNGINNVYKFKMKRTVYMARSGFKR